ncbi:MAG: zinc dependent phospholipase C family protein [Lachnospiraceae bacterium]|nr:zinc dependent phospholipase C family protein [Lachnospiraceae bacterium]MCI8995465.1 zinc dependent phospholipase C family protein [Lachnospiraceae bacterium]MCI9134258.1 zinc dependent phospholipase C family protein [Lachnospiraceae bacterium]
MPATYAHYVFGKKVYQQLPAGIGKLIREHPKAYLLGLHGPDLLFYYRPLGKNRVNQRGSRMHHELASDFFEMGRKVYQETGDLELFSYLTGFLCHFTLDSECHPYIRRYMEDYRVSHTEIETELDRALMEEARLNPTTHNCTAHLCRKKSTERAIASVLEGVSVGQVDESIREFRWCIRLLQCPKRGKELVLRALFCLIGQKDYFGGMLMTGRENQRCQGSRLFLAQRLEDSVETAVALICEYAGKISTAEPLSARFHRDFE